MSIQGSRKLTLAAAASLAGASPSLAQAKTYCTPVQVVQEGETLKSIAERCGHTVPELIYANPSINSLADVRPGRELTMPNALQRRPGWAVARIGRARRVVPVALIDGDGAAAGRPMVMGEAAGPRRMRAPTYDARPGGDALTIREDRALRRSPLPLPRPSGDPLRLKGTIVSGDRCALLRAEDGKVYGLSGADQLFCSGDRVELTGKLSSAGPCDADYTIAVSQMAAK